MPASPPTPAGSREREVRHRAARIEDWIHDVRERWARRRGHVPTIVPVHGLRIDGMGPRALPGAAQPADRGRRAVEAPPQARRAGHPGLAQLHERARRRRARDHRGRGRAHRGARRPRRRGRHARPRRAGARLASSDAAHRGGGAGRGADLDRRHRRRLRHHLRRRRHRHGDRAPPAVRRVLEHVRARRARAHPHPRHGRALRAPRPRPPRLAR